MRIPTPIPAAIIVKVFVAPKRSCTMTGLITVSAKNPITTLGIPASVSRIGFSFRRAPGFAYSER